MKTFSRLWQYLGEFFWEWEIFQINAVKKIKAYFSRSVFFFFRKSYRLWDNVEKYGGVRGATNDVTIWRIRVACWISMATRKHERTFRRQRARTPRHAHTNAHTNKYVMRVAFPRQRWFREHASVLRYKDLSLFLSVSFSVSGSNYLAHLFFCYSTPVSLTKTLYDLSPR
jgi:hypothetical protein